MKNKELSLKAIDLRDELEPLLSDELGFLITRTNYMVAHENVKHQRIIQGRLNSLLKYSLLVYLFAIWEEYTTTEMNNEWLTDDEKSILKAYKHLRHTAAHGYNGKRANNCRKEFEEIMNSAKPFPNLIWNKDDDTINIENSQVVVDCYNHMNALSRKLVERLVNDVPIERW
jgi:hypothetical protein